MTKFLVGKKALASYLGISPSTIERWRKRYKDFPVHKRGGMLFADPVTLAAWIITSAAEKDRLAELIELRKDETARIGKHLRAEYKASVQR